jgi:hypothetical protein
MSQWLVPTTGLSTDYTDAAHVVVLCASNLTKGSHMSNTNLISIEKIEKAIYVIRGEKVMLDRDLAELYEVQTKALNQAVRRNSDRFPSISCSNFQKKKLLS